jgi:uncharacterized LabA/DUF88 family protein
MLLVDTYNLYHGAYEQYDRMVDYDRLIHYLRARYDDKSLEPRFAYVTQTEQSRTFCSFLRSRQFVVRCKQVRDFKADSFDVDLTIDALSMGVPRQVVICSSSLNLLPLIRHLSDEGCVVSVHSCGIPYSFREYCSIHELPVGVMRIMQGAVA